MPSPLAVIHCDAWQLLLDVATLLFALGAGLLILCGIPDPKRKK